MKSRQSLSFSATALGLVLALSVAQAALGQDPTQRADSDSVPKASTEGAPTVALDGAEKAHAAPLAARPANGIRMTRTGSNIARGRSEESLPLLDIDRAYIDRTGARTTPELLRTIPQVQVGR